MGNPASVIDFDTPLVDWLATPVSGGTWADVFSLAKFDGTARNATEQKKYPARIWSNAVDDFVKRTYGVFEGDVRVPGLVAGVLEARPYIAGDETPMLRFVGNGANSAEIEFYAGTRNPNGNVTARPGDVYVRKSGAASELWINVSPGATGSVWSGTAGANPWSQVLANGPESGGTDPQISEGDALVFLDAEDDERVRAWLDGDDWRIDVHDEGGALVGTWSFDTLTGDLDAGANNIANAGTYNGVTVEAHGSRHAAGGADPGTVSAAARVIGLPVGAAPGAWQELTGDQLGAILDAAAEYVRRDGTTPLTNHWDAGPFTITADRFTADGTEPQIIAGTDGGGSAQISLRAAAATSNYIRHRQGGANQWDVGQTHNDANWYLDRFVGGAFQDSTTVANATGLWTYPGSSTWDSASPIRNLGNGAGGPNDNFIKADAFEYVATIYSAAQPRWQFPYIPTDESLRVGRLSTAGVGVNNPAIFGASDTLAATLTTLGDATIQETYANVLHVWGDSTGNPTLRTQKDEVGETFFWHYSEGFPRWLFPYVNASEQLAAGRYGADGLNINFPLIFDNPGLVTRFADGTFVYSADAPSTTYGSGAGGPFWASNKAEASTGYLGFQKAGTDWWLWEFGGTEFLGLQRRGGGGFVNYGILFNDAATVAAAATTFGDTTIALSVPDVTLILGTNGGSPGIDSYKVGSGNTRNNWFSDNVLRAQELLDAAEDFYIKKLTSGGALETEIAMFASGYVRFKDYWAVTDAITAPSSVASVAKFYLDSGKNGRPQLLEADGAREQLGVGIDSQAMPVVHTDVSTDAIEDGTETDILNYTIPANALGATGKLYAKIAGLHSADAGTLRLRVYLDSSTVIDATSPTLGESGTHVFRCELHLQNRNTTDQVIDGRVELSAADTAATGYGGWDETAGTPYEKASPILGTAGEDTTSATVLRVTLTQTGTAPLTEIYTRYVCLAAAA